MDVFPTVSRILDAMLCKINPTHPVLVQYLKIINPDIETGVLLSNSKTKTKKGSKKNVESPSKPSPPKVVKKSKKHEHSEPPPIVAKKPKVTQAEATILPSKSSVFTKLKKKARNALLLTKLNLKLLEMGLFLEKFKN